MRLAWGWTAVAAVDVAVAGAYLVSGNPFGVWAALITILLAVASLWTAVALVTVPERSLAWSGAWGWARVLLMIGGFAAVIGSRL